MTRRRTIKRAALAAGAAAAGVLSVLLCLLGSTPGWFRPPEIPEFRRQAVRDSLLAAEQAFTQSLRGPKEPFVYHINESDVNAWLALRAEIYPGLDRRLPPGWSEPFLRVTPEALTLAAKYDTGLGAVVVSVDLVPVMEEKRIVLRTAAVRSGAVRWPMGWLDEILTREVNRGPDEAWPGSPEIHGNLRDGLRLGTKAWWKNGGMAYEVRRLWLQPGRLNMEIQPLGQRFER